MASIRAFDAPDSSLSSADDPVVGELLGLLAAAVATAGVVALFDVPVASVLDAVLHGPGIWGADATVAFALVLLLGGAVFAVRRWRRVRRANRRLERLEQAIHQLEDSFFVEDFEGRVLFANDATARELGYESAGQLMGRILPELVPEELMEQWRPIIEEMLRTGEPQSTEYVPPAEDGGKRRRTGVSPLLSDGEMVGLVGTSQNISELARAREEARRSERHLQAAQRLAKLGSWEWRIPEDEVSWSKELYRIFDVAPETFEATYEAFLSRVHPDDREDIERAVRETLEEGKGYTIRFRAIRGDGDVRDVDASGELETDEDGEPFKLRGVVQDITDLRRARERAEEMEQRYRTLFSMSPVAFAVSTLEGTMMDANQEWERQFGYDRDATIGSDVSELEVWVEPRDREEVLNQLSEEGAVRGFGTTLRTATGELREVELSVDRLRIGGDPRLSWALRDVTERNQYQRQLEQQALHDSLTGLPNRNLLLDRLEHAMTQARRHENPLAVLFVDLDDFKAVNDSYGHAAGDALLAEMAQRMSAVLREEDTVARLSGDEFVVLLEYADEEEARRTAERLLSPLSEPYEVADTEVSVGVSIGLAVREPGEDTNFAQGEDLLQAADAAMYQVKNRSEGHLHVYSPEDRPYGQRLQRKERLRSAIENDELVVYYQPLVDVRDGRVLGVEALVRWAHPVDGLLPPGEFLPLAEESGLIEALDDWVLERSGWRASRWLENPALTVAGEFRVAVNVAPHRYGETDLAENLLQTLRSVGLPPDALQLEITERLALKETRPFHELRAEGVYLAIDDFGTGYSSLMYLRNLDADALKVDRYFIQELERKERTSIILRSLLSIGAHLELDVIAEGVETAEQRDHLRELGYELAQGYFFARPMPAEDFEELLRSGITLPAA